MDTIFVDLVRYGHLLTIAVGLGSAAIADFAAISGLRRDAIADPLPVLLLSHRLIWPALIGMWLTGLALIGIRTGFQIEAFSPKLFAKLTVVTILTLNAHAIGRWAMPLLTRARARTGLSSTELWLGALIGGVSAASWLLALAMGSSAFLAEAPAALFLVLLPLAYGCAILIAWLVLGRLQPAPRTIKIVASSSPTEGVTQYKIGLFPRRARAV
ncbi:MAG: hypothetical protein AAGA70_05005 [Pseudomonadota bacterium]